jgi:hypothetical protein
MESVIKQMEDSIGKGGREVSIVQNAKDIRDFGDGPNGYVVSGNSITIYWDPAWDRNQYVPNLVTLAHEFSHGLDFLYDGRMYPTQWQRESIAIGTENSLRAAYMAKVPGYVYLGFR